jgi:hypothetical protein
MAALLERPVLHVEGKDDKHALINLLIRHGIDYDSKPWPAPYPTVAAAGSIEDLLKIIPVAVKGSGNRPVGFVLDADTPLDQRWQAARDRLRRVAIDVPDRPPPEGFVAESSRYKSRVGVWLMPDNEHDGTLEIFLRELIREPDPLIVHAESSTDEARRQGASFRDVDRLKAVIYAWLAWQHEPGRPYGQAIRARYFGQDSPAAARFVAWFRRLYAIA